MRFLGFVFIFAVSFLSTRGSGLLGYVEPAILIIINVFFVPLVYDFPEIKITGQSQTVHVPGCPESAFYLTFDKPIRVMRY